MAQATEERVSRLEGAFEQMNERLGAIENNLVSLRQDMNTSMAELRRELHTNFRWTMGTIIAMWVTIICAIMFA